MSRLERVYRLDRFAVPAAAREEFLGRVRATHALLKTLPGFVQDFLLERPSGDGAYNVVTLVEWENEEVIKAAKAAVMRLHAQQNFNPQELYARLGIQADIGSYKQVEAFA